MVFKIEDLFDNYEEYQDHRTMFMYFSLIVLGFVMICGCFKLRNHYAATEVRIQISLVVVNCVNK